MPAHKKAGKMRGLEFEFMSCHIYSENLLVLYTKPIEFSSNSERK
jgi:hypothetical protein